MGNSFILLNYMLSTEGVVRGTSCVSEGTCVLVLVVVQSISHIWLSAAPWTAAYQASLSFTIFLSFLNLMSVESVMPSIHLVFCPLLLLPSVFPGIGVFSTEFAFHTRWPKYWSFSFSISPSSDYSGLISFRIELDLLAVQGILKSLLQHHNLKASVPGLSALVLVHLSHLYMNTGKL